MTEKASPAVVGVFQERAQAERAVEQLKQAGFAGKQIGFVSRYGDVRENLPAEGNDSGTKMEEGRIVGAVSGTALGAFLGALVVGAIPGVGPVLAGGLLVGLGGGAAAGALTGALTGTLIGMGIPETDARYYNREVVSGRTLVTVRTERRAIEAGQILRRCGAYDTSAPGYLAASKKAGSTP